MAPQTSYGALDLSASKTPVARSGATTRLLVGVAFLVIAAVTCLVTFSATTGLVQPKSTVDLDYSDKPELLKDALNSQTTLFKPTTGRKDCTCSSVCKMVKDSPVAGVGTCEIDEKKDPKGECIGFDFKEAKYDAKTKKYTAACELTHGRYDCFQFPCQNGGHCVDGVDDYTCVCEFGWKDKDCQTNVKECNFKYSMNKKGEKKLQVCDVNAKCTDKIVDAIDKKGYSCVCNSGWEGDGFQKDQKNVKFGSILKSARDGHKSWLDRSAKDYSRAGCTDIDDCKVNPCSPQLPDGKKATCTDEGPNKFSCSCASLLKNNNQRWTGKKEGEDGLCDQDVHECEVASLNNCDSADRATCFDTKGSFQCSCKKGWYGDGYAASSDPKKWGKTGKFTGCKDVDDCKVKVIGKDGKVTGYKSPCVRGVCSNVEPGSGKFHCECPSGWEGKICDKDINECQRWNGLDGAKPQSDLGCDFPKAKCVNTPGSFYCFCHKGWTGNAYKKGVRKIKKGRISKDGKELNPGCVDADDCEFGPCKNGATCADEGTEAFVCTCVIGWKGKTCEEDWDECIMGIHTCHESARCHNTPGSFTCACEKGYSGDGYRMCERMDNCFDWEDDPNIDDTKLTDYAHKIYKKQTAKEIEDGKPLELDVEATKKYEFDRGIKSNVIDHAPWKDDIRLMALDAKEWRKGVKKMVKVEKCGVFKRDGSPRTFDKHGKCRDVIAEGVFGMFICDCDPGWADKQCDRDINECTEGTNECHRNADCTNTEGSYSCACKDGYTGDGVGSCHDIDDCTTAARCKYGFCTDLGANSFRCTCMEGYTDKLCDEDIDECGKQVHECGPLATCTNTHGSYTCKCNKGFAGTGIGPKSCKDIDDCASSPCEKGKCKDVGAGLYKCTCDKGWTDFNCDYDVNECLLKQHNCHETGRCVNSPGGFFCRCISGYQGDGYTCTDLDDCDPDPCDKDHGHCEDKGQNKYYCRCDKGWKGDTCSNNIDECTEHTHNCHEFSNCIDLKAMKVGMPCFDCRCKDGFFGTTGVGNKCSKCTDCSTRCSNGRYDCGTGPGMKPDPKKKDCVRTDRKCVDKNECMGGDNCDAHATCANTYGSFTCTCINEVCKATNMDEYPPQCTDTAKTYFGDGTTNNCQEQTKCGGGGAPEGHAFGDYMYKEGTSTHNRVCKTIVEDGWYALQTNQGSVAQCLVKWKQDEKVYPERYSWGGLAHDRSKKVKGTGKYNGMQAADICHDPICGVCDWDGKSAIKNLYEGKEAAWALKRLSDDLYLVMNRADEKGLRCLGFATPDAPYPTLITYTEKEEVDAEGLCYNVDAKTKKATTVIRPAEKCSNKKKCKKDTMCKYGTTVVGQWSMDAKGGSDAATYYCGFQDNGAASAASRVRADGAAIWSIHPLGCRGKWCEKRKFDNLFTIRSLARGDVNKDTVVDAKDYECLYFANTFVGQSTHPTRVPTMGSRQGPMDTFGWLDEDDSSDPDCGIRLRQNALGHKSCFCAGPSGVNQKKIKSPKACADKKFKWICPDDSPYSQEKALVLNKQATWKLIPLQGFDV